MVNTYIKPCKFVLKNKVKKKNILQTAPGKAVFISEFWSLKKKKKNIEINHSVQGRRFIFNHFFIFKIITGHNQHDKNV